MTEISISFTLPEGFTLSYVRFMWNITWEVSVATTVVGTGFPQTAYGHGYGPTPQAAADAAVEFCRTRTIPQAQERANFKPQRPKPPSSITLEDLGL